MLKLKITCFFENKGALTKFLSFRANDFLVLRNWGKDHFQFSQKFNPFKGIFISSGASTNLPSSE